MDKMDKVEQLEQNCWTILSPGKKQVHKFSGGYIKFLKRVKRKGNQWTIFMDWL
jgi:predicted sulfurtransferase